jgi:iron(III) transport system substrate-binding protein
MRNRKWSRRDVLKTSTAFAAGALFAEPVRAAAPPPSSVTPELLEAARKEGKLSFYSTLELSVGERVGKAFEAKYPGTAVRVERSGAERIFQRIAQEQASGINAVDVANSTDPADYLDWKSKDWLAPYLPDDVAKYFPADQVDPDRGAGAERGNQGALRQNIQGAIDSEGGALRSVRPEYFP